MHKRLINSIFFINQKVCMLYYKTGSVYMDKYEKRGAFIVECRKEKGLSQEELANRLNYSRTNISKWETGKAFPSNPDVLKKIADVLDVKVEELINGEKNTKKNTEKAINSILEEYKKEYEKNYRKNIILLISSTLILILLLISIYLFFIYGKVNAYTLSFDQDGFRLSNSMLLVTNNVSFLNINKIDSYKGEKIKNIEIYTYDENNNKKKIISGSNEMILIEEDNGYEEYGLNHLNKREIYMDIQTESNEYKGIKIDKEKRYTNNNIFPKKTSKIGDNNQEAISSNIKLDILKEYGFITDNGEDYVKEISKNIYFLVTQDHIDIQMESEILSFWFNYEGITYIKYKEDKIIEEEYYIETEKNCEKYKCSNIYDYAEYLNYYKNIILENQ